MGYQYMFFDDESLVIENNTVFGVFKSIPKKIKETKEELEKDSSFMKFFHPSKGWKKVGDSLVALEVLRGARYRSLDQESPACMLGHLYDDGDGWSRLQRWKHTCPITGQVWMCEYSEKVSGY